MTQALIIVDMKCGSFILANRSSDGLRGRGSRYCARRTGCGDLRAIAGGMG